jgi:predicted amidohydrolase YtcJ
VPDRPVYIYSQTGHEAWVNSKALELAKLDGRKQDSQYIWDVDEKTGEPSGTIKEYCMSLLEQALEPTAPEKLAPELAKLVETFNASGFTSFKEAGAEVWTVTAANILDRKGELNARVFPSWYHLGHIGAMTSEESKAVAADWEKYRTPMVYPRYVKMYADGSPSSHSSLLFEDYSDRPGFKGDISFPYDLYVEDFSYFNKLGLGMIVHAFGDGSGEKMIEAFEEVRRRNGDNGIPLHYSHSVMTSKEQFERLSKIPDISVDFLTIHYQHPGVTTNFQPPIGEERYQKWLNARDAAEIGIPYGFGGDWPSSILPMPNGFYEMQAFITRKNPYDLDLPTLNAEQALTLEQAIYGFTLGGAHCLGFDWPERLGSIEEGKLADFIVLDRNIFEVPVDELNLTQVDHTVVNGGVVFDRDAKEAQLEVVDIEITNKELDNAVDAADLNLLVEDELHVSRGCLGESVSHNIHPGAPTAPEDITRAFGALSLKGYRYARPAREIYWKNTKSNYWIQWAIKDDVDVLLAYDPKAKSVVEVLRVREKTTVSN